MSAFTIEKVSQLGMRWQEVRQAPSEPSRSGSGRFGGRGDRTEGTGNEQTTPGAKGLAPSIASILRLLPTRPRGRQSLAAVARLHYRFRDNNLLKTKSLVLQKLCRGQHVYSLHPAGREMSFIPRHQHMTQRECSLHKNEIVLIRKKRPVLCQGK